MSTDYSAIVGFGIDLGKTRPPAVFGPRSLMSDCDDPYSKGPFDQPAVTVPHAYAAYSNEHGRYFLFVAGTVRRVKIHEVAEFDAFVDQSKVQAFVEWCDHNEIELDRPRWLFTCYSH